MTNKISVIIPVYNGENFIARAIFSVINQSIKPFEIIVVNDGSKDGTLEQLATFNTQVTVVTIANGGVANARNVGIKASSGDFIAFLDADDIWCIDKLKLQLQIFENYKDVGFCCCNFEYMKPAQLVKSTSAATTPEMHDHFSRFSNDADINYNEPLKTSAFKILISRNFVGTCSNVMVRKNVLDQVGLFNTDYKQSEDYDLWLRLSLVTKFVLLSNVLLEKKTHEENLTNNFLETMLYHEKVLLNLKSITLAGIKLQDFGTLYNHSLGKLRYQIGNLYYEDKHTKQAFHYFFLGLFSCMSIKNFKLFCYYFSRKFLRTLSFGLIKNSNAI